jgi:mannosyltransferase OCH1-like enzyme
VIPKRIFQLTTKNIEINQDIVDNIAFLRANNPEWEYQLLSEDEQIHFLKEYYPASMLKIYSRFGKGYDASRMDFFRYLLIYQFGGLYLDLKSTFEKPLNGFDLDSNSLLVSHWPSDLNSPHFDWGRHSELSPNGEFFNGVIIAPPKNRVLESVIESIVLNINEYSPLRHGVGGPAVLRLTGPVAYTLAVQKSSYQSEVSVVDFFEYGYKFSIYPGVKAHIKLAKYSYGDRWNPIIRQSAFVTSLVFFKFFFNKKFRQTRNKLFSRLSQKKY